VLKQKKPFRLEKLLIGIPDVVHEKFYYAKGDTS